MLDTPFPYFGGKSRIADKIWEVFGDVPNYAEQCKGQEQLVGCLPVIFVKLFVVHFKMCLALIKLSIAFCLNSGM